MRNGGEDREARSEGEPAGIGGCGVGRLLASPNHGPPPFPAAQALSLLRQAQQSARLVSAPCEREGLKIADAYGRGRIARLVHWQHHTPHRHHAGSAQPPLGLGLEAADWQAAIRLAAVPLGVWVPLRPLASHRTTRLLDEYTQRPSSHVAEGKNMPKMGREVN